VGSWFDTIGTWLFKYSPRAFARGEFVTAPVVPAMLLVGAAIVLVLLIVASHVRLRTLLWRDRFLLATLRTAAVLLVLACLFRPGLVIAAAVPQRNVLAVVFDDSRSMRITDVGASVARGDSATTAAMSRLAVMQRAFQDSTALMRALGARFAIRRFRFSAGATPVRAADEVRAAGTRSDLAQTLDDVRQDLDGMPLAGVVLVTDGADNGSSSLDDALRAGLHSGRGHGALRTRRGSGTGAGAAAPARRSRRSGGGGHPDARPRRTRRVGDARGRRARDCHGEHATPPQG
jgi:hypothetical protein